MNKQMTVVDLAIVYAAVIVTIIVLSAVQKLNSPKMPAVESSSAFVIESPAEFAPSSVSIEGADQYSPVVAGDSGADLVEWRSPELPGPHNSQAPPAK